MALAVTEKDPRLSFQESTELIRLDINSSTNAEEKTFRYMSAFPSWVPGSDLPWEQVSISTDYIHKSTYGAHAYAMSGAAVLQAASESSAGKDSRRLDLHTIQGTFITKGLGERPFIFDVVPVGGGRTFATWYVKVRQPTTASVLNADGRFALSDSQKPLGTVCFTCLCSLKNPEDTYVDNQGQTVQERFSDILSSRPADAWPYVPSVDFKWMTSLFPNAGPGTFPILEMRKVDMADYNAARPPAERKEIILYRLLRPLSSEDPNQHALAHAYAADRNGLLMLALDHDIELEAAATLTWSFFMHTNVENALMRQSESGAGEWWILEDSFPRGKAGRGYVEGKIWSPEGVHVATAVQDGLARAFPPDDAKSSSKL